MPAARFSVATKEQCRVQVFAKAAGVEVDPTAAPVFLGFTQHAGPPVSGDFVSGEWDGDPTRHVAQTLIGGPGTGATKELTAGRYHVWIKITDSPEVPVILSGTVVMF